MVYRCTNVKKSRNKYKFIVDGKEVSLLELSGLAGIGAPTIRRRLKELRKKERITYVNNMLFRRDHNISVFDNIYFLDRVEYSDNYMTVKMLAEIVGSKEGQARVKLAKWKKGKIDCDELFRPARELKTGELPEDTLLELGDMQPRKDIEDLDHFNPTKWDREVVAGKTGEPIVFGTLNSSNRRY